MFLLLFVPSLCHATTEISTAGTNLGIGTTSTSNALSIKSTLAVGSGNYASTTAPVNGAIIEGSVGIGTLAPGTALDVNGTVRATLFNGDGSGLTRIPSTSGGWTTDSSTKTTSPYNIGIGTTGAEQRIDTGTLGSVNVNSDQYGLIMRHGDSGSGNSSGSYIGIEAQFGTPAVGGKKVYFGAAKEATFGNKAGFFVRTSSGSGSGNLLERLRITGDGNVGIGTPTPTQKLDIFGGDTKIGINALRGDATLGLAFDANDDGAHDILFNPDGSATFSGTSGAIVAGSNVSGIVTLEGSGGTNNEDLKFDFESVPNQVTLTSSTGASTINYTGTVNATAFIGDGSGLTGIAGGGTGTVGIGTTGWNTIYAANGSTVTASSVLRTVGSNIGIGSATPGTTLDVQGTGRFSSTLSASNLSGTNTGDQTNITGNAGTVTTNANLTGPITSSGNATSIASQTGSGTKFVVDNAPTLITPILGVATGTSLTISGNIGVGTTLIADGRLIIRSGNLGIGTDHPGTVLDVNGTSRMTGFQLSTSPSLGYVIQGNSVGIGTWVDPTTISTSGSGSGTVGIGTTGTLAVYTGTTTTGSLANPSTCAGGNYARGIDNTGAATGCTSVATGTSQWQTQASIGIGTIDAVGIGTYTFGNKLSIVGNVGIGTGIGQAYITTAPDANGVIIQGNVGVGTTKNDGALVVIGNVGVGTWTPVNILDAKGAANFGTYAGVNTGNSNGLAVSGNLGIGTYAPSASLCVGSTCQLAINSAGSFSSITGDSSATLTNTAFTLHSSAATAIIQQNGSSGASNLAIKTGTGASSIMQFFTSNAYRAMIDGGGNVGIGTVNSTQAKLTVVGNIGIGTIQNGDNFITTSPPNGGMIVESNVGIGTWTPSSLFEAGTQKFNVLSGGNVGVGSISPGVTLDVQGTVRSTGFTTNGAYTQSGSSINQFTGNVGLSSATPGKLLDIAGAARMTNFTLTGNGAAAGFVMQTNSVGLGTWVAASTLATSGGGGSGTINSGATNRVSRYTGATTLDSSTLLFDDGANVGIGTIAPRSTVELGIQTMNIVGTNVGIGSLTPRGTLDLGPTGTIYTSAVSGGTGAATFSGNVGIGSTAPGTALDVSGTMRMIGTGAGSFRVQAAANQACTTTCTTGKALFGFDDGTLGITLPHLVGPSDASAEECLCGS